MIVKLLTEHHMECLSLKGGCRGSSESTHVKMPHCWKSHATAHFIWPNPCLKVFRVIPEFWVLRLFSIESRNAPFKLESFRISYLYESCKV